jgi:Sigma-54 interaction domain
MTSSSPSRSFHVDPPFDSWSDLAARRVPILLIASADVCDETFATIAHHLRPPIVTRDCGGAESAWPQGDHTLVLRHPDRLSVQEQHALLRWMDEEGHGAHVVSIASPQLYARVEAGLFLDRLYYRLNAMTFVLTRQE